VVDTEISIIVSVGTAENISAIIAQGTGYASETALNDHVNDHNNPHHVTKAQIGLGNVVNQAPSDMTVNYADISTLEDIGSGNTLAVIVAKIQSAINFLRRHLAASNPHNITPSKISAAAANHTHNMSSVSGTLPISKGGTGVTTEAALKTLIESLGISGGSGGIGSFLLTVGGATKMVNGSSLSYSLAEIGVSEAQYQDASAMVTWDSGKTIHNTTGELQEVSIPGSYYGILSVSAGDEFRVTTWGEYTRPLACFYDSTDEPLSWYGPATTMYANHTVYTRLDLVAPPSASYLVVMDYCEWNGYTRDDFKIERR
jgi:hypothetical protein